MPGAITQFAEIWSRMEMRQRIMLVVGALGTLSLIGVLVMYGTQPEYGVLFSDLKPGDSQSIIEKLKTANVPYKITNGGTTISVPYDKVAELRLQMASTGVLTGGHVGFDIFDKNSFGATDFAQQVNYQRALEGELSRTLEGMDEVNTARVHITRPRESIFADKAERAKASVVLRMNQGRELSRERTESVVNLVASAVEGLDPGDVAVMDTQGRVLSSPTGGGRAGVGGAGAFNSQLEARRKFEAETATRVVSLIEPITGIGHARADVAAELDFSQTEQTEEKFDPRSSVIRSQQTTQESRNIPAGALGGVSGARANDPTTQTPTTGTNKPLPPGDQRSAVTTNYEIDKTVKRTVGNGGRITRLSVSLVVDHKMVNGTATARTPEELKKMQEVVAAAVGIDTNRGDQIVVQSIPFDQPTVETRAPSFMEKYREFIQMGIKYGSLLLAALLLIFFVIRPARKAIKAASKQPLLLTAGNVPALTTTEAIAERTGQENTQQTVEQLPAGKTVAEIEAEMNAQIERELASGVPEVKRAGAIKKTLIDRTRSEPATVAMTLRGWLEESDKQ
jgi:flagellar M-ring protein FliF